VTRSGPSRTDAELLEGLMGRGISVSISQLERWRSRGLIERNPRRGRGRGRGSESALPDTAHFRTYIVAHHSGQGIDLRHTSSKIFVAFPEIELPEEHVRRALSWSLKDLGTRKVRDAKRRHRNLLNQGETDVERLADQAAQSLGGTFRTSAELGLSNDEMVDLLSVTLLGPDAVGLERLIEIFRAMDQTPGDLLLGALMEGFERRLLDASEFSDPSRRLSGRQSSQEFLDAYTWRDIVRARDLMFAFARRMEVLQFLRWMDVADFHAEIFWDGLVRQNFILQQAGKLFRGHVRTLLRPPLDAGLIQLRGLLGSPDVDSVYLTYFIGKFDEFFHESVLNIITRQMDSPEFMAIVREEFTPRQLL
jgi:hypothetical protein